MNTSTEKRLLRYIIYGILILSLIVPLSAFRPSTNNPLPVQQANVSEVIPFLGVITGWHSRNRVYKTANGYIDERQSYYDKLREKARQQLLDREILDLSDSQVAAYTRMVALIEEERGTAIQFAESEKFAARQKFLNKIESAVVTRLLGSGLAQDLFRAMNQGIGSAQEALEAALGKLSGESGFMAEVEKVRRVAIKVNSVSQIIGGRTGENIRETTERIIQTIDKPREEIEAGINQVQAELGQLGSAVSELQSLDRNIHASDVTREVAISAVTGEESDDPAINAIVGILAAKMEREGSSFRERARGALLGAFAARCAAFGERYRTQLRLMEDDPLAEPPDDSEVFAPCNAINLDELEQEVALPEDGEGSTEQEPEPDRPIIQIQSLSKSKSNCGDIFGGEGGSFCDISLDVTIEYFNFEAPGTIECDGVTNESLGTAEVPEGSGTAFFSARFEAMNYQLFEGNWKIVGCSSTIDGEPADAFNAVAGDFPWSE